MIRFKAGSLADKNACDVELNESNFEDIFLPHRQSIHRNFGILQIPGHHYQYPVVPILQTVSSENRSMLDSQIILRYAAVLFNNMN